MPSEEQRRKAGAIGAGTSKGVEDDVVGEREQSKPKRAKAERSKRNTPAEQTRVLSPDVLEFEVERGGLRATMTVPTVLTIGDIVTRRALEDIDAYAQLVLFEGGRLSSIDFEANPALMFSAAGSRFFEIALLTSNVRDLLRRIVAKTAYLTDEKGDRYKVSDSEFDQLSAMQIVQIGANYYGRWIERFLERLKAKNR